MATITIKKAFGEIVKKKYNKQFPNFRSIKNFLKEHQLQERTILSVLKGLSNEWDKISIRKKTARAKNGDMIAYKSIKGLKIANMLDYFAKKDKEARLKKQRKENNENIEVFSCQFVKMAYINTIDGYGSMIVKLENGEIRELFGSQHTFNHMPISEILKTSESQLKNLKTDILKDKTINEIKNEFKPQLMVHYKNKFEWAIDPVNIMSIINNSFNKSIKNN